MPVGPVGRNPHIGLERFDRRLQIAKAGVQDTRFAPQIGLLRREQEIVLDHVERAPVTNQR